MDKEIIILNELTITPLIKARDSFNIALEAEKTDLNRDASIQRFEFTFELAWKTLKDKMEFDGIVLDTISPKAVVRKGFESKYIKNAEGWLKMIGDRNLMSHTYDLEQFEAIIVSIKNLYLPILDDFYTDLIEEMTKQ